MPDIRGQVAALDASDPLAAAQTLLRAVQPFPDFSPELDKINFSHAMTKVNVLGLLSAHPRGLMSGTPIDLVALFDRGNPLQTIVNSATVEGAGTVANRIIASAGSGRALRAALCSAPVDVAASHLVDPTPAAFSPRRTTRSSFPGVVRRRHE